MLSYRCPVTSCSNHGAVFPYESAQKLDFKCFICDNELEDPTPNLEPIIDAMDQIPTTLKILPRLRRLVKAEDTNISSIADLISKDALLSVGIIKIGNSSFYSGMGHCNTVEEALNRVGFTETYKFIGIAASSSILLEELKAYNLSPHDLWRNSLLVATLTEVLSKNLLKSPIRKEYTLPETSVSYMVGLLHSIGKIVIENYLNTIGRGLDAILTDETESLVLGYTNPDVAAILLRKWNFSDELTAPIRFQNEPGIHNNNPLSIILHVAKLLAPQLTADKFKDSFTLDDFTVDNDLLVKIGATEDDLIDIITDCYQDFLAMAKEFKGNQHL